MFQKKRKILARRWNSRKRKYEYMVMGGRGSSYWTTNPPPSSQPPASGNYQIDMPGYEPPWFNPTDPVNMPDLPRYPANDAIDWIQDRFPDLDGDGIPDDPRGGGYVPGQDYHRPWGPGLPPGSGGSPGIAIPPWGFIPPIAGPGLLPSPGNRKELIEAPDEGYEILRTPLGRMPVPFYIDANWLGGGIFSNYNNGFGTIGGAFIE